MEFRQIQEVGIFSYLLYSLAKSHVDGCGCSEAEWLGVFSSNDWDLVRKSLLCGHESGEPRVLLFT